MSSEPRDTAAWRLAQQTRLLAAQVDESGTGDVLGRVVEAADQLITRLEEHERLTESAEATARALEGRAGDAYAATDELRGHHEGAERAARTAFTELAAAAGADARAERATVDLLDALQAVRDELSGADVARVGSAPLTPAPPPPHVRPIL